MTTNNETYAVKPVAHVELTGTETKEMAVLSPENTYTHEASEYFAQNIMEEQVRIFPTYDAITDIFAAVESGEVPYGFVPRENTSGGDVKETSAAFRDYDVVIQAEYVHPINHSIVSAEDSLDEVDHVKSHRQALAQCEQYLKQTFNWKNGEYAENTVEASSTAAAAADLSPGEAAICSMVAGENLGLNVLDEGVQDSDENETSFLLLAAGEQPDLVPDQEYKTNYRIVPDGDHAGLMLEILKPFEEYGLNLSRIQSSTMQLHLDELRDEPVLRREYEFDLDIEAPVSDRAVQAANRQLDGLEVIDHYETQTYPVYYNSR